MLTKHQAFVQDDDKDVDKEFVNDVLFVHFVFSLSILRPNSGTNWDKSLKIFPPYYHGGQRIYDPS